MPFEPRWFIVLASALVIVLDHVEPAPVRLIVPHDAVVANGPAPFLLNVSAVNQRGHTLTARGRHFDVLDNGIVELPHPGQARCLHQGDARIVVRQGAESVGFVVKCRPIDTFGMPFFVRLELGQAPILPTVVAYDSTGTLISEFSGTATIRDSTVVRYVNGMLYPVGVGGTRLEMDFGGVSTHQPIQVVDRVVDANLEMVGGELRTWSLPVGRSELMLTGDSAEIGATPLRLNVYSANCARSRQRPGEQHWYCIGTAASRAIVRNTRHVGDRGAARGRLLMWAMK